MGGKGLHNPLIIRRSSERCPGIQTTHDDRHFNSRQCRQWPRLVTGNELILHIRRQGQLHFIQRDQSIVDQDHIEDEQLIPYQRGQCVFRAFQPKDGHRDVRDEGGLERNRVRILDFDLHHIPPIGHRLEAQEGIVIVQDARVEIDLENGVGVLLLLHDDANRAFLDGVHHEEAILVRYAFSEQFAAVKCLHTDIGTFHRRIAVGEVGELVDGPDFEGTEGLTHAGELKGQQDALTILHIEGALAVDGVLERHRR